MEKTDDVQKKVDEDRSNPQYIPKRGTFYEHDDRTAEGAEGPSNQSSDSGDICEIVSGSGTNSQQSPTAIAHASKTMKKWQPASGIDRWSHDRFDASDQAPKSRAELVNAYGYDIRNEDAPPRARRRRRYGRGPSKYSRNWEDETAYLKASNTQRKPPRPADFPALNERTKPRKTHHNNVREEKENRLERNRQGGTAMAAPERQLRSSRSGERRERASGGGGGDTQRKSLGNNKNKNFVRSQPVGRQAAMEFKNKQRANQSQLPTSVGNRLEQNHSSLGNRLEQQQQGQMRTQHLQNSTQTTNEQIRLNSTKTQAVSNRSSQSQPRTQGEVYNANLDTQFAQLQQHQHLAAQSPNQNSRPHMTKATPTSNLSARLQQVQNRNDPSHVGSIQMHALANQNQLVGQQQQAASLLLAQQQQLSISAAAVNHQDQGRPKRYSSIRRSQHDSQNLDQHHQLMLQDQQLLQANIMHLYHQENLQAQMQALQVSAQQSGQQKPQPPPTYAAVPQPPPTPQQQSQAQQYAAAGATSATTAYYVTASAANAQAPQAAQYAQQPTNYLQTTPIAAAAAPMTYTSPPPPPQAVGTGAAVPAAGPLPYVGPNPVAAGPQTAPNAPPPAPGQPGYQNYANYQNYNTVGGTTYFVPPAQTTSRPVVLPQRRPTNAIPILPPSEKSKRSNLLDPTSLSSKEENKNIGLTNAAPIGSAENIDHIIDNMFVQRPVYQPPPTQARKSSSPLTDGNITSGSDGSPAQGNLNTTQNEDHSTEKSSNIEPNADNSAATASVKETI